MRSALIGALPLLLLLTLLSGSLGNAVGILLLSVVCTLGIGGLFWIGAAILIGATLQLLLPSLQAAGSTARGSGRRTGSPAATLTQEVPVFVRQLHHYVNVQRRQGVSAERLRSDLLAHGWTAEEVNDALKRAERSTDAN